MSRCGCKISNVISGEYSFVNYLDSLDSLTNSLQFPILLNRTTYDQTLPISFESSELDSELLKTPRH